MGTDCHLMYKQRKELLLIQRNNRNEGTLFCTVDREAAGQVTWEAASAVTFPRRGQDLCANSSLLGDEAGSESNPGLAVGIPTFLFTGVCGQAGMPCSSRTPWLSTGHSVEI